LAHLAHSEGGDGNRWFGSVVAGLVVVSAPAVPGFSQQPRHNVVLFVADGLRPGMVNDQMALALEMKNGVHFTNTHSMFPTITTVTSFLARWARE
jgi:uncharacterized protein (DUF2236 family)